MANNDDLKGLGKQAKGEVEKQWGKVTDDNKKLIKGEKDKASGKIQEKYGELKNKFSNDDE